MKTCFLFGHGDAKDNILPSLKNAIERHIEYGVTEFVVGRYGGFDMRAARVLADVKRDHPYIRLLILIPYYPSERHIVLPDGFDGFFFPDGMEKVPRRYAIVRANRYMIKRSDYLIVFIKRSASNTYLLLQYALSIKQIVRPHIENIAELME